MNLRANKAAEILFSSGIVLLIIGLVYAPLNLGAFLLFSKGIWKLGVVVCITTILWSFLLKFIGGERVYFKLDPFPCFIGFWLVIFSNYIDRRFNYFATPFSELTLLGLFCISGLLFYYFKNLTTKEYWLSVVGIVSLLFALYLRECWGQLIFSDDHPSFFYRLSLLNELFPRIPFYNPEWNAGYSAREFFATGSLNIYLLLSPLLKLGLLNEPSNYSILIAIIPFFVLPLSLYFATIVLKLDPLVSVLSIILSLAPSLDFFEWFLRYGTLGFVCSISLLPVVFILSYRLLLSDDLINWPSVFGLLITSTLCFFWTLSIAAFIPLAFYSCIFLVRNFTKKRLIKIITFVLLFFLVNGSWIYTLINQSQVLGFVSNSELPGTKKKHEINYHLLIKNGKASFLEIATKINPLLFFLGLPGLFLVTDKRLFRVLSLTLLWLFILCSFGESYKPQLELRRMGVVAAIILIIPTTLSIKYLLYEISNRNLSKVIQTTISVLVIASILIVPINAGAIYSNRSDIRFKYASAEIFQLAEELKRIDTGGRAFFFGFILHELGASSANHQDGGHIAPLAKWSRRELYASHFFHARWSSIDPIPESYLRQGDKGIEEFLDLMNVTEVIAYRKEWLKYCQDRPYYLLRASIGRFHIFSRTAYKPNPFIEGQGEIIKSHAGELLIKPRSQKIILKYRYLPLLISSSKEVRILGKYLFDEPLGGHKTEEFQAIELEINQSFIDSGQILKLRY